MSETLTPFLIKKGQALLFLGRDVKLGEHAANSATLLYSKTLWYSNEGDNKGMSPVTLLCNLVICTFS